MDATKVLSAFIESVGIDLSVAVPLVYKGENGKDEVLNYYSSDKGEPVGFLLSYKGIEFVLALRPHINSDTTWHKAKAAVEKDGLLLPDKYESLVIYDFKDKINQVLGELKAKEVENLEVLNDQWLWCRVLFGFDHAFYLRLGYGNIGYIDIDNYVALAWGVRALKC